MNICVFDTETTSLDKPFCYNVGYIIVNTDNWEIISKNSYVVEQIWHNLPLFSSAYYADKRPLYVAEMKAHKTIMDKFGYICQKMIRDFNKYEISLAFAFNSSFDEKVFNFNCDWYKCNNPFDNVTIKDIRGFAHWFIVSPHYKDFCDHYGYYTETGNYSTTAETFYRYLSNNTDFVEAHTALNDSEIEKDILESCVLMGADIINDDCKAFRSIEKLSEKTLHIKTAEQTDYYFDYTKIRINKDKTEIVLK
ncbi:MAG: hypothetical protein LIR50_21350 [Bacillota bacterium]|nr:hypothetical protein [Bacillota bacterium]